MRLTRRFDVSARSRRAAGLSREPGDFKERLNPNFLEDHVFLARTGCLDEDFIDPAAAFTLEPEPLFSLPRSHSRTT